MAQQSSRYPEDIRVTALSGLNERVSPANLKPGEFSHLEGLYPARTGLLERVPGKSFLYSFITYDSGTGAPIYEKVLSINQTNNANQDILIQTDRALYAMSLDELLGRSVSPNLTFTAINEEETMSMAIILQQESNTQLTGGSIQGYISGTDSSSTINTFYGRRLTSMPVNESSTVVTFTASTGGAAAASTAGTFTLAPGSYRITARLWFGAGVTGAPTGYLFGLYNDTNAAFQNYAGTTEPIISSVEYMSSNANSLMGMLDASFTVSGSNNTFRINQECTNQTDARSLRSCGNSAIATTANVNSAAAKNVYAHIKILKTA